MTSAELRQALTELQGQRTATFVFHGIDAAFASLNVNNAMLVPEEADGLIKLTDGQSIFVIDAERVAYIRFGQG